MRQEKNILFLLFRVSFFFLLYICVYILFPFVVHSGSGLFLSVLREISDPEILDLANVDIVHTEECFSFS